VSTNRLPSALVPSVPSFAGFPQHASVARCVRRGSYRVSSVWKGGRPDLFLPRQFHSPNLAKPRREGGRVSCPLPLVRGRFDIPFHARLRRASRPTKQSYTTTQNTIRASWSPKSA